MRALAPEGMFVPGKSLFRDSLAAMARGTAAFADLSLFGGLLQWYGRESNFRLGDHLGANASLDRGAFFGTKQRTDQLPNRRHSEWSSGTSFSYSNRSFSRLSCDASRCRTRSSTARRRAFSVPANATMFGSGKSASESSSLTFASHGGTCEPDQPIG